MLYRLGARPPRCHRLRPGDAAEFSEWVDFERGQTTRDAISRLFMSVPIAALLIHVLIRIAIALDPRGPVEMILR
jgi:hypothetical protein